MMSRRLVLLLCLLLPALESLAVAQVPPRQPRSRIFRPPAGQGFHAGEPAPPPTTEELLQRLDELERRMHGRASADRTGTLAAMLEDSHLASTNYYDAEGVRYFVTRLLLLNFSDQPVSIDTSGIVLRADGREHTLQQLSQKVRNSPIQVGDQLRRDEELRPAARLEIPPHGSGSTWLLYSGLNVGPQVPRMELRWTWEGRTQSLDVNEYQRGVLGLTVERLGPDNCLALLTVHGALNTINAGALADALDEVATQGVARAVVAWTDSAATPPGQVVGWLTSARANRASVQYSQLPALSGAIRDLHLANLPRGGVPNYRYDGDIALDETVDDAVLIALKSAFEALPRDELRREIVLGHRLSRAAALAYGAGRLPAEDVTLMLRALHDPDELLQKCALRALREFGQPAVIDALLRASRSPSPEVADEAIASLAGSRFPAAHDALAAHLDEVPPESRVRIVPILAANLRPVWAEKIYGYFDDPDPALRLAALRSLIEIGHPRLQDVLAAALASDELQLREEAFVRLAGQTDPVSEALALDYALERLARERPNDVVSSLLQRTGDRRAIPLLLGHLDHSSSDRDSLITLLAQVAREEAVPELISRYTRFDDRERAVALRTLFELKADEARQIALEVLLSRDLAAQPVAAQILSDDPDDDSIRVLCQALDAAREPDRYLPISEALGRIGTPAARQALLRARGSSIEGKRRNAADALEQIKSSSPASSVAQQAQQTLLNNDTAKGEALLELAILLDPEFGDAFAVRGHHRMQAGRIEEAMTDFDRAIALDPYNAVAVTCHAIVRAQRGEHRAAVRELEAAAARFPHDSLFDYNAACVYGRSVEQVQKEDASNDREQLLHAYGSAGLRYLEQAFIGGFRDYGFVEKDPDLETLRALPEYRELIRNAPSADEEPETDPPLNNPPVQGEDL